ncbi:hypothetical protein [Coleofasciculus sp. FACHB-SPT36]|nr:hypothetical protein [Coleofasciculus sp. FACHB-SPT36]
MIRHSIYKRRQDNCLAILICIGTRSHPRSVTAKAIAFSAT